MRRRSFLWPTDRRSALLGKGRIEALALIQPMAAHDVASAVAGIAEGPPLNSVVEVAGPERFRLDGLVRLGLAAKGDTREVISATEARYFGARRGERTLLPGALVTLASTRFEDWISQPVAR